MTHAGQSRPPGSGHARLSILLVLAGLCPLARASNEISPWGQPIADIRLQADARMSVEEFAVQIVQQKGQPLDRDKVAESLKNLYATGRFRELRADAEQGPQGVVLVFVARARFFVGMVRVEGTPKPLDPSTLVSAARLRLGQPLSEADLTAASGRIAATLADNGYYQAKISHRLEENADTQETNVVFTLVPGSAARLEGVEFHGRPVVAASLLATKAGWRNGMRLTAARVDRGLSKLRKLYLKQSRYQAAARVERRIPDPAHNTEHLIVHIDAGPIIHAGVRGAKIRFSKLRSLLPVYTEGLTDDLALATGQHNLQDYLEREGYYNASVKWDRSQQPDKVDITYTVAPGPRGEFVGYGFKGKPPLSTEQLETTLEIRPANAIHRRGTFSHELLAHDLQTMTALFRARGYLQANVTPQLHDQYQGHPGRLFVTFQIEEGQRTTVRNLTLAGIDPTTEKKLRSALLTRPGQPYSPARADTDRDSILTDFANRGYGQVTVAWEASPASPDHQVDLKYDIQPGPQEHIQRLIVMGNRHTRRGTIQRQLTLSEGRPLNQSEVFESQRRLYDLGVFNQVQIAPQDPEASETARTVLVSVEEAHRWTLGYGGGLDVQRLENVQPAGQYKASPRLSLELSRIDVGGRAQTFSLGGRLSNLETGGSTTYLIPRLGGHTDLSLRFNGLVDQTRDVLTFTSQRREVSAVLEKQYSSRTFVFVRYTFRHDSVSNLNIPVAEVPLSSRSARVAGFGATYVTDRRDNPIDATAGSYSLADVAVANRDLGSQSNFVRLSGQNATYYRLNAHLIFARDTRLGLEETYGGSTPTSTNVIPLPELLFMGGSESHRGFSINQAGPRDPATGYPVGGKALFLNSLELRFPFERNHYGLVLFNDAGNVFSSVDTMRLLKFHQSSPTDFDYTVLAVGVGFRYQTPIGPLRFDVGYNLNPPRYQVLSPDAPLEIHRLPAAQLFLSVGQSF